MDHPSSLQSDGMLKRHVKTAEKRLRKVILTHQTDRDVRLPTFLLAYSINPRGPKHDARHDGVRDAARPSLRPVVWAPSGKKLSSADNLVEADRVGRLRGRHHYVRQHLDGQLQDVSPSLLPLPWDPGHMELPKLQPL